MLGRVDQKQTAERPERLAAEILIGFLIEQDDAFSGIGQLGRCDETRKPATDDNYVRVIRHVFSLSAHPARLCSILGSRLAECILRATLRLNLNRRRLDVWTKTGTGNTVVRLRRHHGDGPRAMSSEKIWKTTRPQKIEAA